MQELTKINFEEFLKIIEKLEKNKNKEKIDIVIRTINFTDKNDVIIDIEPDADLQSPEIEEKIQKTKITLSIDNKEYVTNDLKIIEFIVDSLADNLEGLVIEEEE